MSITGITGTPLLKTAVIVNGEVGVTEFPNTGSKLINDVTYHTTNTLLKSQLQRYGGNIINNTSSAIPATMSPMQQVSLIKSKVASTRYHGKLSNSTNTPITHLTVPLNDTHFTDENTTDSKKLKDLRKSYSSASLALDLKGILASNCQFIQQQKPVISNGSCYKNDNQLNAISTNTTAIVAQTVGDVTIFKKSRTLSASLPSSSKELQQSLSRRGKVNPSSTIATNSTSVCSSGSSSSSIRMPPKSGDHSHIDKQLKRDRYRAEVYAINCFLKKLENEKYELFIQQQENDKEKILDVSWDSDDSSVLPTPRYRTENEKRKEDSSTSTVGAVKHKSKHANKSNFGGV